MKPWSELDGLSPIRRYSDDYLTAETAAKAEQIGLWQGPFIRPEAWRQKRH